MQKHSRSDVYKRQIQLYGPTKIPITMQYLLSLIHILSRERLEHLQEELAGLKEEYAGKKVQWAVSYTHLAALKFSY